MIEINPPRLSLRTKLAYAIGGIPNIIEQRGLSTFLLTFYNQVVGMVPYYVAMVLLLTSIVDAIFDPVLGQISDRFRSRWGRRHPFIYASVLPLAIGYWLLWCPPLGWSQGMLFGYLLVLMLIVRIASSCFELPVTALLPELTPNYDERTSIISLRMLLGMVGAMVMVLLAYRVFLRENPDGSGGVLARSGYFGFGLASSLVIASAILIAGLGTQSRIPFLSKPPQRKASLSAIMREVAATLNNRSYAALLAMGMLMSTANGAKTALELYFNLYFWELSQARIASLVAATFVGIIVGVGLAPALARWLGKRTASAYAVLFGLLGNGLPVFGRLIGIMPANGTTALFVVLFVDIALTFSLATTNAILMTAMLNDVIEDAEVKTGRRSEGLLLAAETLLRKVVSSLGIFVSGLMLTFIAFPQKADRGAVPPEVVAKLAWAYLPMIILYLLALGALSFYRIDRATHEANLALLRRRKTQELDFHEAPEAAGRDMIPNRT